MKKVVEEKSFLDKLLDLPGVIIKGYEKIETVGCVFKIYALPISPEIVAITEL